MKRHGYLILGAALVWVAGCEGESDVGSDDIPVSEEEEVTLASCKVDANAQWSVFDEGGTPHHSVWAAGPDDVWVGGRGRVRRLSDGAFEDHDIGGAIASDIAGNHQGGIWVAGQGLSQLSNDGTWLATSVTHVTLSLWMPSPDHGVAVGRPQSIHEYRNGVWELSAQATFLNRAYRAVWGSSRTDIWFAGQTIGESPDRYGFMIHRVDGYDHLVETDEPMFETHAIWGSTGNDVYFAGSHGRVLHYDGESMSLSVELEDPVQLRDVHGLCPAAVWAVGDEGSILTFDGESWNDESVGNDIQLHGVFAIDEKDVWAVGTRTSSDRGVILRRSPN